MEKSIVFYHPDGSMTEQYRQKLLREGYNENEIINFEKCHQRRAIADRRFIENLKRHTKRLNEGFQAREAERQKRIKQGLEVDPKTKVLYSSPKNLNSSNMSPIQRLAIENSGLSLEERLSQGITTLDDLGDECPDEISF